MMKMKKAIAMLFSVVLLAGVLVGCSSKSGDQKSIVVLDGQFTEIDILQYMAKILIEEHTDLTVQMHDSMYTVTAAQALEKKEVDLYVGYDGTLLSTILGGDASEVPQGESLFEYTKKRGSDEKGLTLNEKFGFENTYAIAVREDDAKEHDLKTISDLVPLSSDLIFGAEHEFFDEEGTVRFKPLNDFYGLNWKEDKSVEMNLKYAAIDNKNIDVTVVYSTDGLNKKSNLRILEDDRHFFPEYFAAYEMRTTLFEEFQETAPNLKDVLDKLNGQIDNETMAELNYRVDALQEKPEEVAREFLREKGLI